MKARVFVETDPDRKRQLQMRLTAQLPQWFGKPDSNAKYAKQAEVLDGYVAEVDRDPCGLLLLKRTSVISAEIYWMAVTPARHRQGVGRALVGAGRLPQPRHPAGSIRSETWVRRWCRTSFGNGSERRARPT